MGSAALRRLASLPLAVAGALAAGPAAAESAPLVLTWDAPDGCPSGDAVTRAASADVTARADRDVLRAVARVTRAGDAWQVFVRTSRGGERRVVGASCAEIGDATALLLALALKGADAPVDREATADAPPETAAETPADAPPAASAPPAPERVGEAPGDGERPRDRASSLLRFAFGASGALATSVLPHAAAGASAELAWTPGPLRIAATAGLYGAQSGAVASGDMGARFRMRTLGGRACFAALRAPIELGPCAGLGLVDVRAQGRGMEEPFDTGGTWASLDVGARAAVPLGRVAAIVGSLEIAAPLARPTFVVEGAGFVHRPSALGLRAALGAEIHFP